MAHTFNQVSPNTDITLSTAIGRLLRDNVLRVGLVLAGMTLFIAAAEAKTPVNELALDNLPELVSQIANQSTMERSGRMDDLHMPRQYLTSDDFAASAAPRNVLNSPVARFLADRLD